MLQHFLCHKTLQIVIAAAAPPPLLLSSTSSAAIRVACFAYCTLPASAYSYSASSALSLSPPMCSTFLRQFSRARQIPKPNSPKLTSTKNSAHWNMLTVTRRSRTGGEEGGERGEQAWNALTVRAKIAPLLGAGHSLASWRSFSCWFS